MKRNFWFASKLSPYAVLLIGAMLSFSSPVKPDPMDVEGELTQERAAEEAYKQVVAVPTIKPEERQQRRIWLAERYPGTVWVTLCQKDALDETQASGNWDQYFKEAAEFLDKPHRGGMWRREVINQISKAATNRTLPEEVRTKALNVFLLRSQHAANALFLMRNPLNSQPLSPAEKWKKAKAATEACGYYSSSRAFLWNFFPAYAKAAPQEAIAEAEWFLEKFGKESAESIAALQWLLKARGANNELAQLQAQETKNANEVAQIFAQALELAATDEKAALEKAALLKNYPPRSVNSRWWTTFTHTLKVPANKMKAAMLAVNIVPPGQTLEELWVIIRDDLIFLPEAADFQIQFLTKEPEDIQQDFVRARSLLRGTPALDNDPWRRFRAHIAVADVARKLGEKDQEAEYRAWAGKYGWGLDRDLALASLRRAIELAPNSPGGTEAKWFLSLLEGKHGVTQETMPRGTIARFNWQAPAVKLPAFSGNTSLVETANGRVSLRKFDPKTNLLAGQMPIVSAAGESAAQVTDGKADSVWTPPKLPATIIVPMSSSASPQRLALNFTRPTYFTVSFLDADGNTVAKTERDWRFNEYYQTPKLWPAPDNALEWPGTFVASFVKVEMYSALGATSGIKEMALYPAPYASQAVVPEQPSPLKGTALNVKWNSEQPRKEVTYGPILETARGHMFFRWRAPWFKARTQSIRRFGPNVGLEFYGDNVKLALTKKGRVFWTLDDVQKGSIDQEDEKKSRDMTVHDVAEKLPGGRHQMVISFGNLDTEEDDTVGAGDPGIIGAQVLGTSRAGRLIRFGDGKSWGAWLGPLSNAEGTTVSAPDKVNGKAPTHYQVAALLDSREVQGLSTASTGASTDVSADTAKGAVSTYESQKTYVPQDVDAVANALQKREVIVVYPREGSKEEYDAAKKLANKAGVYLVSDDLVLGGSSLSNFVAVGTPLSHRFNRQLPGMTNLWEDFDYLNSADGLAGKTGKLATLNFYYVTGETPAAVTRAAAKVLDKIGTPTKAVEPLRIFSAISMERIYPWELHLDRSAPSPMSLRLAQNDRRAMQFGVSAGVDIKSLECTAGTLTGPGGATLGAPEVRPVLNYEWEPFFGEMRLPEVLQAGSTSLKANTSLGIWVTVRTPRDAKPGVYQGAVTIKADGVTQSVPVKITVEPIPLLVGSKYVTNAFANVPWYFHEGSAQHDRAIRQLADNEADHGFNSVNPMLTVEWQPEMAIFPASYAIAPKDTTTENLKWQPYGDGPKAARPGEAIFFLFKNAISPRLFAGAFRIPKTMDIECATYNAGQWKSEGKQQPFYEAEITSMDFAREAAPVEVVRFSSADGLSMARLSAFLDPDGDGPIVYDATRTLKRMDVFDEAYKKRGLPLPMFICYANFERGGMSQYIYGISNPYNGGHIIATNFAKYFRKELQKTGRDKRFAFKVADEPDDIVDWAKKAAAFKKGGLLTMTCHSGNYPEANIQTAVGIMDPWCPNLQHDVLRPFFKERQKAGDKVWWYVCGYPVTRLTGPLMENLPFAWLSAKWGFDGGMDFAALFGTEANESIPFRFDHGTFHRLVMIPDGSVLDTTRREMESEGIYDYKTIEYIRSRIAEKRKANQKAAADEIEGKLDKVIETMVPFRYGYSHEPKDWYRGRNDLYDIAVAIK